MSVGCSRFCFEQVLTSEAEVSLPNAASRINRWCSGSGPPNKTESAGDKEREGAKTLGFLCRSAVVALFGVSCWSTVSGPLPPLVPRSWSNYPKTHLGGEFREYLPPLPRELSSPGILGFSNRPRRNPANIGRTSVAVEPGTAGKDSRNIQSVLQLRRVANPRHGPSDTHSFHHSP